MMCRIVDAFLKWQPNREYKTEPECIDVECGYDFSVVMLAVVYST